MTMPIRTPSSGASQGWQLQWLLLILLVMLTSVFFVARYEGRWAETDSAAFARILRANVDEGRLIPQSGEVYSNGFTYQGISLFLVGVTGVDVLSLQQLIYPLLACLLVLPAWLLYRELSGSSYGATLGTALLLIQPEFLFVILRSSHEKFTRALMLVALYLLVRSFNIRARPHAFGVHVVLLYLVMFALIASNNLLSHSFILAIAAALGAGWVIRWRAPAAHDPRQVLISRLQYVVTICLVIVYIFTFYAYTPATVQMTVLQTIWERVAALILDVHPETINPYNQVSAGWINLPVFFVLSSANWIALIGSLLIWLRQTWRWVRRREMPATSVQLLLWLLYTAFAVQGALSIVADISGAIGNLQHRLFSSFVIVAVALIASELAAQSQLRRHRLVYTAAGVLMGCIAVLSVLKASNEPLLSNRWNFYRPSELHALAWSNEAVASGSIWIEFDERLNTAADMTGLARSPAAFTSTMGPGVWMVLVSDVTRLRVTRLQQPLPILPDSYRVYDNGEAQFYRLRPRTPYQQ